MAIVYQYCNTSAFMSIMSKKTFWLTPTNHMNDYKEVKYVWDVYNDVINGDGVKFVDDYALDMLKRICRAQHEVSLISCFSYYPDILSQWRAYSSNGEGFSIGIDTSRLDIKIIEERYTTEGVHSLFLAPVKYVSEDEIKDNIFENIRFFNERYKESAVKHISAFSDFMRELAESTKGKAFSEEKEIRIIYQGTISNSDDGIPEVLPKGLPVKYRMSGQKIIPYCELEIPIDAFREVYVGPRNTSEISDIKMFLQTHGLSHVEIKQSNASYR